MQAQSQEIENLVYIMQNGIDKEKMTKPNFIYHRVNAELDSTLNIEMDETNKEKLEALSQKASYKFHEDATNILKYFGNGNGLWSNETNNN